MCEETRKQNDLFDIKNKEISKIAGDVAEETRNQYNEEIWVANGDRYNIAIHEGVEEIQIECNNGTKDKCVYIVSYIDGDKYLSYEKYE